MVALSSIPAVLQLIGKLPDAARLLALWRAAQAGDLEAAAYLRERGLYDALNLVAPHLGDRAATAREQLASAAQLAGATLRGDIVDAEYRVLDGESRPPWSAFLERLLATPFGAHIILGPQGQGKTSLAKRLAQRYRDIHHYRVEAVAMYGDDLPAFAVPLNIDTLVHRAKRIKRYLLATGVRDEDELVDTDEREDVDPRPPSLPPTGRVIIIDEASVSQSTSPSDPGRNAAITAIAHCRHVGWIIIFIAQWAGMLPPPLFGNTTQWVKRPNGDEEEADRDNRLVRQIWREAGEAFATVRSSPYWPEHPDIRAWAYCRRGSLNGGAGYQGLIPFSQAVEAPDEEG